MAKLTDEELKDLMVAIDGPGSEITHYELRRTDIQLAVAELIELRGRTKETAAQRVVREYKPRTRTTCTVVSCDRMIHRNGLCLEHIEEERREDAELEAEQLAYEKALQDDRTELIELRAEVQTLRVQVQYHRDRATKLQTEPTALGTDTNSVSDPVRETLEFIRRQYEGLFKRLAE